MKNPKDRGGAEPPRKPGPARTFDPPLAGPAEPDRTEVMIKQPETRPISQEQLVAEVKGIYAGLVMVESKCIEVDNTQNSTNASSQLNNEQCQALIALHRTLLHEHHDFLLASQHPSASPALRQLASKYAMPARMWRHGIHTFLELLRRHLPASFEHMLSFLYLAYSTMALLLETVPTFEDTWIECLGDLSRYRIAIEYEDIEVRRVWTAVSRPWYSRASDKAPATGRLYHQLAIVARCDLRLQPYFAKRFLEELFYYTKSLCVPVPFLTARESIMTLFKPHLSRAPTELPNVDAAFIRAHGILFSGRNQGQFAPSVTKFIGNLKNRIRRKKDEWKESGYHIVIALGCALLEYGSESNVAMEGTEAGPSKKFLDALNFTARTHDVIFRRKGDPNVYPYLHVTLSFLYHMSLYPSAMAYIEEKVTWKLIAIMLNHLLKVEPEKIESDEFPRPGNGTSRPLPEDFAQRGLLWVDEYYPNDWFTAARINDDEKGKELTSTVGERQRRCLWLGYQLASSGKWLTYHKEARRFWVATKYDVGEKRAKKRVEKRLAVEEERRRELEANATTEVAMAVEKLPAEDPSKADKGWRAKGLARTRT